MITKTNEVNNINVNNNNNILPLVCKSCKDDNFDGCHGMTFRESSYTFQVVCIDGTKQFCDFCCCMELVELCMERSCFNIHFVRNHSNVVWLTAKSV
jgi:hypothetical protein